MGSGHCRSCSGTWQYTPLDGVHSGAHKVRAFGSTAAGRLARPERYSTTEGPESNPLVHPLAARVVFRRCVSTMALSVAVALFEIPPPFEVRIQRVVV